MGAGWCDQAIRFHPLKLPAAAQFRKRGEEGRVEDVGWKMERVF